MIEYTRGAERPVWRPTITANGSEEDYSSGFTFQVTVTDGISTVLTKTTGITGAAGGVVNVDWAVDELDITPGRYRAFLRIRRVADSKDLIVDEVLLIGEDV